MDRADYRFTRREVREATGWAATQTRIHLDRLVELEYVAVHRGRRGQGFVYELAYDGQGKDGRSFLVGLASTEMLAAVATTETWRGRMPTWRGGGGPIGRGRMAGRMAGCTKPPAPATEGLGRAKRLDRICTRISGGLV